MTEHLTGQSDNLEKRSESGILDRVYAAFAVFGMAGVSGGTMAVMLRTFSETPPEPSAYAIKIAEAAIIGGGLGLIFRSTK